MLYAKVVTIRDAQVPASPLALAPRPHPLTPSPCTPFTPHHPPPAPSPSPSHPEQVNEKKVIEKERQEEARRPRYSEM